MKTTFSLAIALLFSLPLLSQKVTRPSFFLPEATGLQVNTYTGAVNYQRQDLYVPGRGFDFDISFQYNSRQNVDWGYGLGWSNNYNIVIEQLPGDKVKVTWSNGQQEEFTKVNGNYVAPAGVYHTLVEYEPGKYFITTKDGMKYHFNDLNHRISIIEDRNGNTMAFTYNAFGLTSITGPAGRQITMEWQNGRMVRMTEAFDTPARVWSYFYNNNGNLEKVQNPMGYEIQYFYALTSPYALALIIDENDNETQIKYRPDGYVDLITTCITRHEFVYDRTDGAGNTYIKELVENEYLTNTYEYDSLGRNTARSGNCCGNDNTYTYDANNNITQSIDANGNPYLYEYDALGNATKVTDPEGCIMEMAYAPTFSQVISSKDKNGNITTFDYDANGNLATISRLLGITESYTYYPDGNQQSYTDGKGYTTSYGYDAYGYLTQINHPEGGYTTQYTYDGRGNQLTATDANGRITQYTYDLLNRLTEVEDPLGHKTTYEYDARGNKTKETNALGHFTEYIYDQLDRLIEIKAPLNTFTKYTYDSRDNLTNETDQRGSTTRYIYDDRDYLITQVDPLGYETTYTYDLNGNQLSVTDPNGNTTQYVYDMVNRLKTVIDPMGYETNHEYDCNGNVETITDANGNSTNYAYDALNRQASMTDAMGYTTNFEYDNNHNLELITDAKGNSTSYEYDGMNRKTKETFADNTTKVFTYDGVGNVKSRKDNAGNMTYYDYDKNNRLILRDYPDTNDDSFQYDALGRMTSANNENATVTFAYDVLDRMLSETLNGKTTGYAYNNSTGKRTLIYPSGQVVEENFDTRHQLTSIKASNDLIASFTYDPAGRMITRNYGNGTITTYSYDSNNRVIGIVANPGEFLHFEYAYDNVGNKLYERKLHQLSHSELYSYDANYRLTTLRFGTMIGDSIPYPDTLTTFDFDELGNRINVIKNDNTTTYQVNEMNEYVNLIKGGNNYPQIYDDNGNLISENSYVYSYDHENKMIKVTGNFTMDFQYDYSDRRIEKSGSMDITNYYYSNDRMIYEKGKSSLEYIYGSWIDDIIKLNKNGEEFYYHSNDNGSIYCVTNESGQILERYDYDKFGLLNIYDNNFSILDSSALNNTYLFTGRRWDKEFQKYFFRKRYYDPITANFIQRDPVGYFDGMNLYHSYFITIGLDPYGTISVPTKCKDKCKKDVNDIYNNIISKNPNLSKCKVPKIKCECSKGEDAAATYNILSNTLSVCGGSASENTIIHELQHYFDDCEDKCWELGLINPCDCEACDEIRGFVAEGGCKEWIGTNKMRKCLENVTEGSRSCPSGWVNWDDVISKCIPGILNR